MRRRGFSGPFRGPARQFIDEQLMIAHSLFESRQFAEAGVAFERIAQAAAERGGPRAPRFFLQAGRSYLYSGSIERGMALLEQSRNLFIHNGRTDVIPQVSLHLQAELQQLGLNEQAKQIARWADGLQVPQPNAGMPSDKNPILPLKCPSCDGPVLSHETNWLDENTAECVYCGSPIRGE